MTYFPLVTSEAFTKGFAEIVFDALACEFSEVVSRHHAFDPEASSAWDLMKLCRRTKGLCL